MNQKTRRLTYTAMFAVINYIVFTFGKINVPTAPGHSVAIHLANASVVLSAWFLGPVYGGLASAVGLSIADFLDPRYILSAPKTFLMKFLIAYIAGRSAEKMKLHEKTDRKEITRICAISSALGLGFNVIFDPIIGYFYKSIVLRIPQEFMKIIVTWTAGVTTLNAVVSLFVSVILYLALYKAFLSKIPE